VYLSPERNNIGRRHEENRGTVDRYTLYNKDTKQKQKQSGVTGHQNYTGQKYKESVLHRKNEKTYLQSRETVSPKKYPNFSLSPEKGTFQNRGRKETGGNLKSNDRQQRSCFFK